MKPRTKLENQIIELSSKIQLITDEQLEYAYKNCLDESFGMISRKTIYCLECGETHKIESPNWHNEIVNPICPSCKTEIKIIDNKSENKFMVYYAILDTISNFQIVRMFSVTKYMKKSEKPKFSYLEVMQHWISESGDVVTLSKKTQSFSNYYDLWISNSDFEIRAQSERERMRFNLSPYCIFPKYKLKKFVKRNGFKRAFYGVSPQVFFSIILKDSYAETILKARQISLFKYYSDGYFKIEKYWKSIKICIRNNYKIKDFSTWKDYLDLLEYFKKDLLSPKYVCPLDLDKEHNKLVSKKRKIQRKEKYKELKAQIIKDNVKYLKSRKHFFDLELKDNNINLEVVKSVKQVMDEGDILNHCIFTNEYHKKEDSLLFSVKLNNNLIGNVEFSLSEFKVKQCRGLNNKPLKYHEKIVELINKNLPKIRAVLEQYKLKKKRNQKKSLINQI